MSTPYRIKNYFDCFVERQNAVSFCKLLESMHDCVKVKADIVSLEDLEFDKLLGKGSRKKVEVDDFHDMMPFMIEDKEDHNNENDEPLFK